MSHQEAKEPTFLTKNYCYFADQKKYSFFTTFHPIPPQFQLTYLQKFEFNRIYKYPIHKSKKIALYIHKDILAI